MAESPCNRRFSGTLRCLTAVLLFSVAAGAPAIGAADAWKPLAPGLELGTFPARKLIAIGDARITVLRVDPAQWELAVMGSSWPGETGALSAKGWCEKHGFVAAINAGMYGADQKTHLGHLRSRGHVNNRHINRYQSVAAFDPKSGRDVPPFSLFDLDVPGVTLKRILADYATVVQNLRLIKKPGENRWAPDDRRWNEAALGEDRLGRALFIFTRTPFTMHDFNQALLSMGIGIVAAQHLDGGSVAQLYLKIGTVEVDLVGGYETAFGDSAGGSGLPIPNVIGIRPQRAPVAD